MKMIRDGTTDSWSFEVDCEHCRSRQTVTEGDLFLLRLDGFPIDLPSFVCCRCSQTTTLMSGEMPIDAYWRLPRK